MWRHRVRRERTERLTNNWKTIVIGNSEEPSVSGSVGILVKAIDLGQLSKEQGNHSLRLMIAKGYYTPVETLDQFLSQ